MANENERAKKGNAEAPPPSGSHDEAEGGSKIVAPEDDRRGDKRPGFGKEGPRSELGDAPPEGREQERARIAEHNRRVEQARKAREGS
jgi:hypothetical protein